VTVEPEVLRRSPLAARASDLARLGGREIAFVSQVSLRTRHPGSLGLPTRPNTWTALVGPPREALWLGPDEWLVVGPPATFTAPGEVASVVDGLVRPDSLVDVSASRAIVELRADDRLEPRTLLEHGCSIDLHPRAWRAGMCAQTLLARVPVILQQRDEGTRVFVRPSFADWLVDWLVTVAP
jgi:sarcosine oxidase subunit gamma